MSAYFITSQVNRERKEEKTRQEERVYAETMHERVRETGEEKER